MTAFPHTLPPLVWQPEPPTVPAALYHLTQAPSLTLALQATGADFCVQLAFQGAMPELWPGVGVADTAFHVRQVWLLLDDTPVVWARSVCPLAGAWQSILACGTQPLGKRLFDSRLAAERSPLAFAAVPPAQQEQAARAVCLRRSVFDLNGEKMVLTEGFMPELARFWEE